MSFVVVNTLFFHSFTWFQSKASLSFSLGLPSVYSSEEDEEETEMYEHDYDGSMAKTGKRHLGKTRWTREEVQMLEQAAQCKLSHTLLILPFQLLQGPL